MPLPSLLAYALTLAVYLKYPLIAVAMVVGGPALIIACGFLLRLGALDLIPLFLALGLGELTMDVLWYYVGYYYADRVVGRHGSYFGFSSEMFEKLKTLFERYHTGILFAAKVMMGFGIMIAILVTAGATRIPLRKYILVNAVGEVVWLSVMLFLGYFFGSLYTQVADNLRIAFVVGVAIVIAGLMYAGARYARQKALR